MRHVLLTLGSAKIRFMLGLILAGMLMVFLLLTRIDSTKATSPRQPESYNTSGKIAGQIRKFLPPGAATAGQPTGSTTKPADQAGPTRTHVELFQFCVENYRKSYRQYSCRLEKQERLGGKLTGIQTIDVKVKENPFSVLMVWQDNAPRGDKLLYVEDPALAADEWRMFIHPSGLAGRLIRFVEKRPDDPDVLKSSLRSIKEFGFDRSLQSLIKVYNQAQQAGDLLEASYVGTGKVDGRPTIALKRVLPNGRNYPAKETIIEIDQEYLVPVRVRGTNWQNELLCEYVYKNIRFNDDADVKDSDFTRKANDLD